MFLDQEREGIEMLVSKICSIIERQFYVEEQKNVSLERSDKKEII